MNAQPAVRIRGGPVARSGAKPRPAPPPEITIGDIPDAVFATDLDNRITHWADSAQGLFGYSSEEAIGRSFGDLVPFEMRDDPGAESLFAAIRVGRTWRGVGTVRVKDGSVRWIESTVKPRVAAGRVFGCVSVSRDMTELVEAEKRLADEQRFVTAVLDVAEALVVVTDLDGNAIRFNHSCETLTGFNAAEVLGRPVWGLLTPPGETVRMQEAFDRLLSGERPIAHESHWLARNGTRSLISWSSTCLTDPQGAVSHIITTGSDVTELRQTHEALRGVAAVGQMLASHGPSDAGLSTVLRILATQFGYRYLALLLDEGERLRTRATRGYRTVPATFAIDRGVVGRVYRSGRPEWIRDVRTDADYVEASKRVLSEICVPLVAHGRTIGVLNIEAGARRPFTERDFQLAQTVGERVAYAILLGREQEAVAERAHLLRSLSEFARATSAILEPDRLVPELVAALAKVFPSDVLTLTTVDPATGTYRLSAVRGLDDSVVGVEVGPGDGPAGRAIEARTQVGPVTMRRESYLSTIRHLIPMDALVSVTTPLVRDDAVLGAISIARANLDHPFSDVECEIMQLFATQAALALANAHLHKEVSELAIHDGLTGLFNRRHFDATLDLVFARWRRHGGKRGVAAIMFDLDHFGRFNKEHGHQAGDAVLRSFAGLLRERLRSSDLVARYGGEEFVVVIEECSLAHAVTLAEDVRSCLEQRMVDGPLGERLRARVSAGCAELGPVEPTKEALLRAADLALLAAKRAGRNRVVPAT